MSLLSASRRAWRAMTPEPVRRLAQPVLGPALEAYVRRQARAPHAGDQFSGPIRVVGDFGGSYGIAASARLAVRAFEALGAPVEQVDIAGAKLDWIGAAEAARTPGPWIFHVNAPELLAALAFLGPRNVLGPRYGYWAWELPKAPKSWLKDVAMLDEVWAPSDYTAGSFLGAAAPVRTVPHPLFMEDYRDVRPAEREAGFLAVTLFDFKSSAARKNPDGMIAAFAKAFPGDPSARLVIKTQNAQAFPAVFERLRAAAPDNVEILDASWPYEQVKSLIASADVLLSLHRAEGFGLTMAEAMALGTPVIGTGWSGNIDFMDETCALLVPSAPIPVEDQQGIYKGQNWAEPDIDAAAAALRRLRADPDLAARLSTAGQRRVLERLSPQAWFTTLPDGVQRAALSVARSARRAAR
ncbi:glycosyltransferase [Phenylobacterium koreense]|uniref:Glycosyltransferase involved in cell wall biosynthesis n=1 Tax=Phenylobacterium koreense TaxID=266125 RepID=A0ABV2EJA4_9CAUL